jgi:antibiotic biosynthesis monooxygenase (ABM) superfamily enzyme
MPSSHLPQEEKVEKDGYTLTFYPGFCSSASVRDQKGDHELFVQKETSTCRTGRRSRRPGTSSD